MIPGQQISSLNLLPVENKGAALSLLNLKPGQIVNAKVLDVLPQGRVLLALAGLKVTVLTDLALTADTRLALEVTRAGDSISLKPILPLPLSQAAPVGPNPTDSPAFFFSQIAKALPELGTTQDPILKDILLSLSLKSGTPDENFLPRLIENIGMTLEKKMGVLGPPGDKKNIQPIMDALVKHDLKAAVLSLLSSKGDGAAETFKGISNALESFQQINSQPGDTHRFLLPFPILGPEQFEFGQLLVDVGKKKEGKEGNKVIQIAFLMNMTALGGVRAQFSILDKAITGRFLLETPEICAYMADLIPELKNRLLSNEYQVRKIDCQVAPASAFAPNALVKALSSSREKSGLDLVI